MFFLKKVSLTCRVVVKSATLFFAVAFTSAVQAQENKQSERPNIIVIMSDDMGWSDVGSYGGEVQTPRLDNLAENGLRFTQFYNNARCCPTRASLLTGLYPHQAGVGHMLHTTGYSGYQDGLTSNAVTLANVLSNAGYGTIAVGKWHVTNSGRKENWPLQRGFDKYYGIIAGAGSFFDPPTLTRGNQLISAADDPEYKPDTYYFTDAITDNAIKYIDEHIKENKDKPFFLYCAHTAAHWPMHALPEDIEKYKGKYDEGYDAIRQKRISKLKELGLIPKDFKPSPTVGDLNDVEHKEWEIRNMEVYAAMIDRMDQNIGKMVDYLKKNNKLDNTIIFYLQDNGACAEELFRSNNDPNVKFEKFPKEHLMPAGHPTIQTRDGRAVLTGPQAMAGPDDTYQAYGLKWANVSNTPFREYKHWVHEGGISTPLTVHWPKGIAKERHNSTIETPAHLIDIMSTVVDLSETSYPAKHDNVDITPAPGVSLAALIKENKPLNRPAPIFWEHESNRAVRDGNWKLVAKDGQPWELYDISKDRAEMNDLAASQPEKVSELSRKWELWAEKSQVLPLGAWKRNKGAEPNNKKKKFSLHMGESLKKSKGPSLLDKGIHIKAHLGTFSPNGVIFSHGGRIDGYSLVLQESKLSFNIRIDGKLTTITSQEEVPMSVKTIDAVVLPDKTVRLLIDDIEVAKGKIESLFVRTPAEGITVGNDPDGTVGEYPGDFKYKGDIVKVDLEILKETKK